MLFSALLMLVSSCIASQSNSGADTPGTYSESVSTAPEYGKCYAKCRVGDSQKTEWQEILCKADTTPEMIRELQNALNAEGLYKGAIDGKMNGAMTTALTEYQKANGLPTNNLNMATLKKLGVIW